MTSKSQTIASRFAIALSALALLAACGGAGGSGGAPAAPSASLAGAWRSQVQFTSGPFANITDLDFMYAFHADGTLTESSNYDAAPPVPPAYGVWRGTGPRQFQAHYEFYTTRAPDAHASLTGGWPPAGRGLLDETITLAPDGASFTSSLHLRILDAHGHPTGDVGEAQTHGARIDFERS